MIGEDFSFLNGSSCRKPWRFLRVHCAMFDTVCWATDLQKQEEECPTLPEPHLNRSLWSTECPASPPPVSCRKLEAAPVLKLMFLWPTGRKRSSMHEQEMKTGRHRPSQAPLPQMWVGFWLCHVPSFLSVPSSMSNNLKGEVECCIDKIKMKTK